MDTSQKRSSPLPLAIFRVPRYRYFPTNLMDKCGPEQWERLWILQACERLEIPARDWPKISFPQLSHPGLAVRSILPIREDKIQRLKFPPFSWLEDTIPDWKQRCHDSFDEYLQEYAAKFEALFQEALKQGIYTKIPQPRDTTPFELRYEWAAKRLCYNTPYKKLAARGYTEDCIKQTVGRILKKARLKQGT